MPLGDLRTLPTETIERIIPTGLPGSANSDPGGGTCAHVGHSSYCTTENVEVPITSSTAAHVVSIMLAYSVVPK